MRAEERCLRTLSVNVRKGVTRRHADGLVGTVKVTL
jgi:hypothetical protein